MVLFGFLLKEGAYQKLGHGLFALRKQTYCHTSKGIGILCLLQSQTDCLVMQLKAKEKDAVLVIAVLKGTYCMMQRSTNDTKIKLAHRTSQQ